MDVSGLNTFKKIDPFLLGGEHNRDGHDSPIDGESINEHTRAYLGSRDQGIPGIPLKLENIQPANSRVTSTTKKAKLEHTGVCTAGNDTSHITDALLARLSEQTGVDLTRSSSGNRINNSTLTDQVKTSPTTNSLMKNDGERLSTSPVPALDEVERLKRELDAAKEQIAKQDKELHKTRVINHVLEQTQTSPVKNRLGIRHDLLDDSKSDVSESMSNYSRGVNVWDSVSQVGSNQSLNQNIWSGNGNKPWANRGAPAPAHIIMPQTRNYAATPSPLSPEMNPFLGSLNPYQVGRTRPRANSGGQGRTNPWAANWTPTDMNGVLGLNGGAVQQMGAFGLPQGFDTRSAAGSTLSAMAPEFVLHGSQSGYTSPPSPSQSFIGTMEPLNYRKLLDRSVSCNWKYIVDKIVCSNDQQASIFLQQKLKVGTAEQKFEIVEAIVAQAYPLMINRFGNFLVQRCFEHGTPEQVTAIAEAIRGNTLSLSMDAFGCHVVQKAFDAVPEEYKAIMVHELLRRIPETVIHRYACHVWQKLFELRWSDSPPQIMKHVNAALDGMWHEVALGETGSLVVQNIFENCLEEDKRPCIDEVLKSIDIISHGQFGNWCIQHICEHGAPADRSRAIDHVLRYATEYSMDQFASKVVEKCLKIGSGEFLERYLERVCEGRSDRPRIPLIDIASDQYGNYLIQYILTHANAQHREIVAAHIRKHMVSLRGSKFGSRVGLLCCNPAYATRPGPTTVLPASRYPAVQTTAPLPAPSVNGSRYPSGQFH